MMAVVLTPEQSTVLATLQDIRRRAYDARPWSAARAALETEAHAAWQRVRKEFDGETVIPLDDVPACETGAPLPLVLSDGHRTCVSYYVGIGDGRAILRFDGVDTSMFGGLNDEALHGHRLYSKGLAAYAFHEVIDSAWISARERENSVHPSHRGGWHALLRHFIFTFHDEIFECIARSYTVQDPHELPDRVARTLAMDSALDN